MEHEDEYTFSYIVDLLQGQIERKNSANKTTDGLASATKYANIMMKILKKGANNPWTSWSGFAEWAHSQNDSQKRVYLCEIFVWLYADGTTKMNEPQEKAWLQNALTGIKHLCSAFPEELA